MKKAGKHAISSVPTVAFLVKKAAAIGVAGVLITLIVVSTTNIPLPFDLPDITNTVWYTQIDATFIVSNPKINATFIVGNPEIRKESLSVKNTFQKGIFLSVKPSVKAEEKEKENPPQYMGVVNFTTVMEVLDEAETLIWTQTSHLTGFGRKHFVITLTDTLVKPGYTYTVRFTTRLIVTPPIGVNVDLTRTFEETFTSLDMVARQKLQRHVEEQAGELNIVYYQWLVETLNAKKGSYFMDDALNHSTLEAAFEHVYEEITYRKDRELYGQNEYFANASVTIKNSAGDCEDKSILLASTLYWKDIDQQAKVVVGEVLGKGHAWVETGNHVYDPANNIIMLKIEYYTIVTNLYFYFTYDDFKLLVDTESTINDVATE